jgi:uncharacterized protein HemX
MSESRSQSNQAAMAVLMVVILFGALFVGFGGWVWMRMRAQRAEAEQAMRMAEQARYQELLLRQRVEAEHADAEVSP